MNLFGVGTKSESPAITAQKRINCFVEVRKEQERTSFALVRRPGLKLFNSSLGASPARGLWAVNTLAKPLMFVVEGTTLSSIDNASNTATIGAIGTSTGDVSMADDGTFLVLVDGTNGYVYNMVTPAGLNKITDGNFTTTPRTVTWQDNYFIVTSSGSKRQFQLSQISPSIDPTVWPSVQINFAGSGAGALQNGKSDHSILALSGDIYTEFWQDQGTPDFPFALIPGASLQFGLASPWSLAQFDNTLAGLFQDIAGALSVFRMSGFALRKVSDHDMDEIFLSYPVVADAKAFAFTLGGHPMYVIVFPTVNTSWMFDAYSNVWSQLTDLNTSRFWGQKFASFQGKLLVSDYRNGNIYQVDENTYTDNGSVLPMEVWTRHIWNDDKYIGISQLQIDMESGVGLVTGQGVNPVVDLQVSKDGGNTFFSVGYSSIGAIGKYTQRIIWNSLGAAVDWVLKLVITDPVKVVITGASAEIMGARFGGAGSV